MAKARFDRLVWDDNDLITIDGVRFQLCERFEGPPRLPPDTFWLFKGRPLMDDYFAVFARYAELDVRNIFELGIWETGSVAFWTQCFQPEKHVAVDLASPRTPAYFNRYIEKNGLQSRVRLYWQTNQADAPRLLDICRRELTGPLDLVIDDASHLLAPTVASLVTLFPLLREGGLFIVEDWAWKLNPVAAAFPKDEPGLIPLIDQLKPLAETAPDLLRSIEVRDTLFTLERGPMPEAEARTQLTRLLSPRYKDSPLLIKRMVRATPAWRAVRSVVRKVRP